MSEILRVLVLACTDCGRAFPYRYAAERPGQKPTLRDLDRLCDACFDHWMWTHPPSEEAAHGA